MKQELEAYFEAVATLGGRVLATDRQGQSITLDKAIAWTLDASERTKREDAKVFFIGNGGSAAIASHMAADWTRNGGFAAMSLNDGAALTCFANDFGYDQVFAGQLARHARAGDLLFAISSSGRSANIINGVGAARAKGTTVVTLSGFEQDNPLRSSGDMNFFVPSGRYGFVEIAHLTICHAILDLAMGWRAGRREPAYATHQADPVT
jgi:D-sedoheptulose 7-phosphate isomerase